jgi:putative ABC transport system ATP-binding protein
MMGTGSLGQNGDGLAIDLRNVCKTFESGSLAVHALKNVDLAVRRGEFMMLAGPSGSGKTTLLSTIGCVLRATGGEVWLFGEKVSDLREKELPRIRAEYIGFIFQGHNLIASLSAMHNVVLQLELRGYSERDAANEAVELLDRVGLADKLHKKPGQLSGGQRQRVAIARAIAGAPPLVLADEPTGALDAENGRMVTEILRDLAKERGHTVVVVTHDNRIFQFADRIVHIEDGRIARGPHEARVPPQPRNVGEVL